MRLLGICLAIVTATAGFAPSLAFAAGKEAAAPAVSKENRAKGMAAAPGLISAGGIDCQVADARFVGEVADAKTKAKTDFYEIACTGNEGLLVQQIGAEKPTAFTCLQADEPRPDGKPSSTSCVLPGNADPKAGLLPYVAKSGVTCTPDKMRAVGQSTSNVVVEVACHEDNGGYIMQISSPPRLDQPITANPCMAYKEDGNIHCELTPRATQMAMIDRLTGQIGKPCTPKDRRYIGSSQSGKSYYEVACQDGHGYVIETAANGSFSTAIDCAAADNIAGGCTLTDARQSKTEQSGLYTGLAKKAGYDCSVAGYAPLPLTADMPHNSEVVELKCSNRPDGAVAIFTAAGTGTIYDCAHSELLGYRCSLTKAPAAYPKLTADLRAVGKTTCTVSDSRVVGKTPDGKGYVEVACSDGLQGYVIEYTMSPMTPKTTILCAEAKGIGGGCALPGNLKKS